MAGSPDLSKNALSLPESISVINDVSDRLKSITEKVIDVLQLEDNDCKNQIINDLFEGGRQALVKYENDIVIDIYTTEMSDDQGKLRILLKEYFQQQWETQYGTSNKWFVLFLNQYQKGEKHALHECVLTRTAEYGNKYMKNSPILSIVLQLLFEGIDDDCLQETPLFIDLWFTITTKGIKSLTKKDENATVNFLDYIVEDVMNEQTSNNDSALFQALRMYYDKILSYLFERSNVRVNNDAKSIVLDAVANDGLLKGVEVVERKTTKNLYKKLLEIITAYLKEQEELYLKERQIFNVSPSTKTETEIPLVSPDIVPKDEKELSTRKSETTINQSETSASTQNPTSIERLQQSTASVTKTSNSEAESTYRCESMIKTSEGETRAMVDKKEKEKKNIYLHDLREDFTTVPPCAEKTTIQLLLHYENKLLGHELGTDEKGYVDSLLRQLQDQIKNEELISTQLITQLKDLNSENKSSNTYQQKHQYCLLLYCGLIDVEKTYELDHVYNYLTMIEW